MAHVTDDRVLETSTTTGTGALALGGAVAGFRAFGSVMTSPSDTCWYALWAVDGSGIPTGDFEAGLGTYSAANTLTRTTVIRSSNAGAAVTLAAGTKYVAITALASRTLQLDNDLVFDLPATPTTAVPARATDRLGVFARKVAGRMTLKYIGPSAVDQVVQDKISENRFLVYLPNTGSTAGLALGGGWTDGGTLSHPTPSSTAPAVYSQQKRSRWANVVTTTNQLLGKHTATAEKTFWRGNAAGLGGFNMHCRFAIGLWPAATVRLYVGLNDQNTSPVASDTLAGNHIALWHDTTMAATVLNLMTRDGTTTNNVALTLPASLAAGQCYDFWLWSAPNGSVIGYRVVHINSGTVVADGTTSTNIPANTVFLGPTLQMSNGTANITVTTTAFELMGFSCQSDN